MNSKVQNFLVTGGAGFVGRHVVERLTHDHPESMVWIIDDYSTGLPPERWPGSPFVRDESQPDDKMGLQYRSTKDSCGRLRVINADAIAVFLGELGKAPRVLPHQLPRFQRVYHLASVVGGRAVIEGDPMAVGIDLAVDSSFFLWAVKVNKPERVLYASSSAAYPIGLQDDQGSVALAEPMIDPERGLSQPDMTYGWSKLTGEYLSRIAASKYGLKVAVVRPFSGYGEDQDPVYPVPAIALRAAARQDPLFVWGTGEQARDFVHIDDCVEAMERAIHRIEDGRAVNIGSGKPTTFLELARLFADIEGYSPLVQGLSGKPVGVAKRYCNPSGMKELLGFSPAVSIREGMSRVIARSHERLAAGVRVPD